MIEEMGEVLATLRKRLLGQGDRSDLLARDFDALSRSLSRLAGLDLDLARSASPDTLVALVAPDGEVDPTRCRVLAETLYLDGLHAGIADRPKRARESLDRAHRLYALLEHEGDTATGFPGAAERMREIEGRLEGLGAPESRLRPCGTAERPWILEVVNEAAEAYRGVIPADRWTEPYMSEAELDEEIDAGVEFLGAFEGEELVGVMGVQRVENVALIRHAYVRPRWQGRGIGTELLERIRRETEPPLLVGTWAAAEWAVAFYRKRGFRPVPGEEGDRVLRRYWSIPERQVETSVILADRRWWEERREGSG